MKIPTGNFTWMMCFKFLLGKRDQRFISIMGVFSIVGVAIGVSSMMVIFSVISGFENTFQKQILGVTPHILMHKYPTGIDELNHTTDILLNLDPEIIDATPFILFETIIQSKSAQKGIFTKGDKPDALNLKNFFSPLLYSGKVSELKTQKHTVIIGSELAEKLKVKKGDSVKIIRPRSFATHAGQAMKVKTYEVAGVFKSGISYSDSKIALMSLNNAQRFWGKKNKVTGLEISLNNPNNASQVIRKIDRAFPDYLTREWKKVHRPMFEALKIERAVMALICIIIIIVAAVNIVTMLVMITFEKQRQISILKALGATKFAIIKVFLSIGLVISFLGTLLGIGGGFVLLYVLKTYPFIELPARTYQVSTLPVTYLFSIYPLIALFAVLLCGIATLYPSFQAARVSPISGIKGAPTTT